MIERLAPPVSEADLRALALLLVDAVESGAAVSFLSITQEQALDWWRRLLGTPTTGTIVLVARDGEGIAGSVQLHPSWAPNQPHRADVADAVRHAGLLEGGRHHPDLAGGAGELARDRLGDDEPRGADAVVVGDQDAHGSPFVPAVLLGTRRCRVQPALMPGRAIPSCGPFVR